MKKNLLNSIIGVFTAMCVSLIIPSVSAQEEEGIDVFPVVEFAFWVFISTIFLVIIVEAIKTFISYKEWYVSTSHSPSLLCLGQFSSELKLANHFYQFNFNKVYNREREDGDDAEDEELGLIKNIKTPTTIYSNFSRAFIEERSGGVIFYLYRVIPLFRYVEKKQVPDYLEIYERHIKNTFGSKLRYALYKFPCQFLPGIRSPYFKWIVRNMERGKRLTEVPFLEYTVMEEKYTNLYTFRFRKIIPVDDKEPRTRSICEHYGEVVDMENISSEIMELVKASELSHFCESCKYCPIINNFFREAGFEFDVPHRQAHGNYYECIKSQLSNKQIVKDYGMLLDDFVLKLSDAGIINNPIDQNLSIAEKLEFLLKIICDKYTFSYQHRFTGTKALVPLDEKAAIEQKESREELMASHLSQVNEMGGIIKRLSAESLELRKANILLNAQREEQIGIELGAMRERLPDLADIIAHILKRDRLGAQDINKLLELADNKIKAKDDKDSAIEQNQILDQLKGSKNERDLLMKILEKKLTPEELDVVQQGLGGKTIY